MHNDIEAIMYTKQEIDMMVHKIATQINEDYEGKELLAIVILKGSIMYAADLIRCLSVNVKIDFMQV